MEQELTGRGFSQWSEIFSKGNKNPSQQRGGVNPARRAEQELLSVGWRQPGWEWKWEQSCGMSVVHHTPQQHQQLPPRLTQPLEPEFCSQSQCRAEFIPWNLGCFSPSCSGGFQSLGCRAQKTSLGCLMSQSEGWEKENPKRTRWENPNYPQFHQVIPYNPQPRQSISSASVGSIKDWIHGECPKFPESPVVPNAINHRQDFSKGFSNPGWSLQSSPLQLRSRETSFPITTFSINNRNYCTQCLPQQLELQEEQRLQLRW